MVNQLNGELKIVGEIKGGNKGYHIMSDDWFDEYNYEVVVHKDYLTDELNDIFQNAEPILLKPWDPMGALAK